MLHPLRLAPVFASLTVLAVCSWSPCAHAQQWEAPPAGATVFHTDQEGESVSVEVPDQSAAHRTECETPCSVDRAPGPLTVHVSRPGAWRFDETVMLPPGATSVRVRGPRRGMTGTGIALMTTGSLIGTLASLMVGSAVALLGTSSTSDEGLGALMGVVMGAAGLAGGAVATGMIVGGSFLVRGGRAHLEVDPMPAAFAVTPTVGGAMFTGVVRF